jgi:hypothetical protein
MSPIGTKRTCSLRRSMSAFGGKAAWPKDGVRSAFDPQRTFKIPNNWSQFTSV